jgi:hypothetical protein
MNNPSNQNLIPKRFTQVIKKNPSLPFHSYIYASKLYKMNWKWILGILVLAGVGYGLYQYNRGAKDLSAATPDLVVTATALAADFLKDEESSNTKYLNKVVQVSGKVTKIEFPVSPRPGKIVLFADSSSSVICEMAMDERLDIKVGDEAKINGTCSGYLMDVILNNGRLARQ